MNGVGRTITGSGGPTSGFVLPIAALTLLAASAFEPFFCGLTGNGVAWMLLVVPLVLLVPAGGLQLLWYVLNFRSRPNRALSAAILLAVGGMTIAVLSTRNPDDWLREQGFRCRIERECNLTALQRRAVPRLKAQDTDRRTAPIPPDLGRLGAIYRLEGEYRSASAWGGSYIRYHSVTGIAFLTCEGWGIDVGPPKFREPTGDRPPPDACAGKRHVFKLQDGIYAWFYFESES